MKKPICWLMAFSLLLNVLLVGYVVGQTTMHPPRHGWMMKDMPPEKRARLDEIMGDTRAQSREHFKVIRAKRDEAIAILTAPEFDEAAFRAKSKEISDLFRQGKERMIDRMVERARTLSQEDRKLLAESMMRHGGGKGHR